MADASRFPRLAPPLAIVGAAAGWLSAGLLCNPLVGFPVSRPIAAAVATAFAALSGAVIERLCVGRRYTYELGDPDPDVRPATDHAALHAAVVTLAGALAGALTAAASSYSRYRDHLHQCALSGAACALAFLPVCLAVIAAARRAQRARLGSLVADSDRRAVWGILATALAVTTLEALPDWEAARLGYVPEPAHVVIALGAIAAVTLVILLADSRALARAREAIAAGLSSSDADAATDDDAPAHLALDLGLGDDRLARIARGASAYRDRARTIALVRGSPDRALATLRRAIRRGVLGLAGLAIVGLAHLAAQSSSARALYHEHRCRSGYPSACLVAADLVRDVDPAWSSRLRRRYQRY